MRLFLLPFANVRCLLELEGEEVDSSLAKNMEPRLELGKIKKAINKITSCNLLDMNAQALMSHLKDLNTFLSKIEE